LNFGVDWVQKYMHWPVLKVQVCPIPVVLKYLLFLLQ
jgi:hypothetical protein